MADNGLPILDYRFHGNDRMGCGYACPQRYAQHCRRVIPDLIGIIAEDLIYAFRIHQFI